MSTSHEQSAHERVKTMMTNEALMSDVESPPLKLPPTDDELVEQRAQEQFKRILEQKREHDLQEKITARIHELAQAAGLKPQSDEEVLKFMASQKAENMKRATIEKHADKLAEKAHGIWLQQQRKGK